MRFACISINDRGNIGARQVVAQAKALGHDAFLINFGEYKHDTYEFSETAGHCWESINTLLIALRCIEPGLVGISYRSAMAPIAAEIAGEIRKQLALPILAGGIGATSDPDDARAWASYVVEGEAEGVLADLLGGKIADARGPLCEDLDSVPFPDFDPDTTSTIVRGDMVHPDGRLDNDLGAYPLLTSRGCPRACSYCHNSTVHAMYQGQSYCRQRSVQHVLSEIAWARSRWDIKLLSIYDDLFIADPLWIFRFCRDLPSVWPARRRFWCMTHPYYIRDDVIAALCEAGLEEVCLGVQSGSDRILRKYRRGTTVAQIQRACTVLARHPVAVKIDIISANPMETEQDRIDTMRVLQSMPMRRGETGPKWHPGLSRLTVFPGSAIGREITEEACQALHTPYQDFVDGLYRAAFVPRWNRIDLARCMGQYAAFDTFRKSRVWPEPCGVLSDEFWTPLTAWLDGMGLNT